MTLIFSHALLMIKNPSMVLHYLFVCGLQHSHIDWIVLGCLVSLPLGACEPFLVIAFALAVTTAAVL